MDLPCSLLSLHVKRQVPAAPLRKATGLGETEEWKKLPGIHVLCMCASFVVPLIQTFSVPSVVFLLPLPAILTLKLHHWAIGLVAQGGIHRAHISRAFWSAAGSMAGFSPHPFIQGFRAAKQQSRAAASSKAVLAQPGNLWSFLNKGLVA